MKRFLASVLALLFLLTGCAADTARQDPPAATKSAAPATEASPVFTFGGTHRATADYGQVFTFRTTASEACTLNIETRIFDEEQAARLWKTVTDDLKTIAANVPVKQTMPEIYIVQQALHGAAERIGFYVYCTAEDVESGAYREALVCATLGIDPLASWWKTRGITAFAVGETADEQLLRTYYQQATDKQLHILSLFPAYFMKEFASERELSLAHETALSLTAYIVEKYGAETFLAEDDSDNGYRQEWLTALGVDRIYVDPYVGAFAGYSYASSPDYPLIITTDKRHVFHMIPLPGDVDTPEAVRDFLYWGEEGVREILAGVKEFAPQYYKWVLHNCNQPISYYFKIDGTASYAYSDLDKVVLTQSFHFLHETVHLMVPVVIPAGTDSWRYEAIAEYLPFTFAANTLHRAGDPELENCFRALFDETIDWGEFAEYRSILKAAYLRYVDWPQKHEEVDVGIHCKVLAETTAQYPQYAHHGLMRPIRDSKFSYEEAYAFANYLIDKHSLSTFLRYCREGDHVTFEELFGVTLEEAREEWIEEISA